MKSERRVAWILLGVANAEYLSQGNLTVQFSLDGQAKGFLDSGFDQNLIDAIYRVLGMK